MKREEWTRLKKDLHTLHPEQRLRVLLNLMQKESTPAVKEDMEKEVKKAHEEKDAKKEWKRGGQSLRSRVRQVMEQQPTRVEREKPPLEEVVRQEQPHQPEAHEKNQKDYLQLSVGPEYKSQQYEERAQKDYGVTPQRGPMDVLELERHLPREEERFAVSESERAVDAFDPVKTTEMYKKKRREER